MNLRGRVFGIVSNGLIRGLQLNRANQATCRFFEQVSPVYRVMRGSEEYLLSCPNETTRWRAETFFTKEPETLEWIDTFKPHETLFDVGANVGLYSIYAAKRGIRVTAFEPESQNYALLNKNIFLNQVSDHIVCLNVALSDADSLDYLYLNDFRTGGSLHNFGSETNWRHQKFQSAYKQAVIGFSLDSFLTRYPEKFPNHIKIDVDGLEAKIIQGAEKTLRDSRLRTILIEINDSLESDLTIAGSLEGAGLKLSHKGHTDVLALGESTSVFNYIFVRLA